MSTTGRQLNLEQVLRISTRIHLLHAAGYLCTEAADILKVDQSTISHTLRERRAAEWLRVALADLAGVKYKEFWGVDKPELSETDTKKLNEMRKAS